MIFLVIFAFILCLQHPAVACAYVGPGLGLGTLGVIFGIFTSIFFAIIGIFYYPIKRIVRKLRGKKRVKDA